MTDDGRAVWKRALWVIIGLGLFVVDAWWRAADGYRGWIAVALAIVFVGLLFAIIVPLAAWQRRRSGLGEIDRG